MVLQGKEKKITFLYSDNNHSTYVFNRLLVIESFMEMKEEKKYYGNSTHPGAHFPLSMALAFLFHNESAKSYVDTLTKFQQELPPNAWPSWTVCVKFITHH